MTRAKTEDAPIVAAARQLQACIEEIERLTARSSKVQLDGAAELERAGDLLAGAEAEHRAFVKALVALSSAVDDLRARQNASAAALSQDASALEARRAAYTALEARFARIADSAQRVSAALAARTGNGQGEPSPETTKEGLRAVREQLSSAAEQARELTEDCRESSFGDLERQAHAVRQRLASLLRKVDEALEG